MKNSGVEWIGDIPEDWEISRIKYHFYLSKSKAHDKNPTVLRLARSGVQVRDISTNEGQMAESYENYNPVLPNDLLLNTMDLQSGANCNVSEISGVISPAYANLRALHSLNPKFFDYYFKCQYWSMAMFVHGKGISFDNRWTMNTETLMNYYIPFPCYDEQCRIVKAINSVCNKIDSAISNQNVQIEKLKEYKQSIITEAVTKGLDPTALMKDSGVEWIGNIKSSYKVYRLKFALKSPLLYGANESGDVHSQAVRYIRITDITNDNQLKDDDNNQYLTEQQAQGYILSHNDVLFARSGGTVGKTFIFNKKYGRCAFAGYLIKAECNEDNLFPKFLMYYTQSSLYDIWKSMIFIQSTIQNIGANKYANLEIILPPIREQLAIVGYLDKKCAEIDKLISIKQQKIEKLQEHKKSLIYEYVTGKKEVV